MPTRRTHARARAYKRPPPTCVRVRSQTPRLLRPRPADLDGRLVRDAQHERAHLVALARHERLEHRVAALPKPAEEHLEARRGHRAAAALRRAP
jgi:hypothetical protein